MTNPSLVIAHHFIEKAAKEGKLLTPMKLLKLVFYAHGWHLAITKKPLIDEAVEAWRYGPVVPSLYHYFKRYGLTDIKELPPVNPLEVERLKMNRETNEVLDVVWNVYSKFTAVQLSNMSHEKGAPWDVCWNEMNGRKSSSFTIPNELIERFYYEKGIKNKNEQ